MRAAVLSIAAIVGGAVAVAADPTFRNELPTPVLVTILTMLALLCLCSYAVSRTSERRLVSIAELTMSRPLLLADVMTAEERERRRIAETLHDGALQTVLAAKQDLRDVLRHKTDEPGVARASELLADVSRDLRHVTRELHPSVLDEAGLAVAVQALAQALRNEPRYRSTAPSTIRIVMPTTPRSTASHASCSEMSHAMRTHATYGSGCATMARWRRSRCPMTGSAWTRR